MALIFSLQIFARYLSFGLSITCSFASYRCSSTYFCNTDIQQIKSLIYDRHWLEIKSVFRNIRNVILLIFYRNMFHFFPQNSSYYSSRDWVMYFKLCNRHSRTILEQVSYEPTISTLTDSLTLPPLWESDTRSCKDSSIRGVMFQDGFDRCILVCIHFCLIIPNGSQ